MGTFSLADSHHKKVVFLILYTVQCRDFWLHCIEVLQEEKKEERDVASAGLRCVLCRSQKTFSSTSPFRSWSWTEIEHRRWFLGKTSSSPSFTTEKWSKRVSGFRPLATSDWESTQHCGDTELCLPLSILLEKYCTEPSRLLQTTHPFKLIGVIEKLKCSAYLQSYRFM